MFLPAKSKFKLIYGFIRNWDTNFKIHLNFRAGASIARYCIIGLTHNGLCSTCEYYLILLDILGENISCIEKSDSVNSEGCHNNERLCRL